LEELFLVHFLVVKAIAAILKAWREIEQFLEQNLKQINKR
jgi:hypothetical protein